MQDRLRAKKLTIAPIDSGIDSTGTWASVASVFSGVSSWSSVCRIAADAENLHVSYEHEKGAGEDKTDHDGARYRLQRVLCFIAECGGAFEPDKTEDRDHNAETDARPR